MAQGLSGHNIPPKCLVAVHEQGVSPGELQDYFSTRRLTLAEIYAALAYYNDHKDEVEGDFAEDERLAVEGMAREAALHRQRSAR